jgi:hypothetical protein
MPEPLGVIVALSDRETVPYTLITVPLLPLYPETEPFPDIERVAPEATVKSVIDSRLTLPETARLPPELMLTVRRFVIAPATEALPFTVRVMGTVLVLIRVPLTVSAPFEPTVSDPVLAPLPPPPASVAPLFMIKVPLTVIVVLVSVRSSPLPSAIVKVTPLFIVSVEPLLQATWSTVTSAVTVTASPAMVITPSAEVGEACLPYAPLAVADAFNVSVRCVLSVIEETVPRTVLVDACSIKTSPAASSVVNSVDVPVTAVLPLVNAAVPVRYLIHVVLAFQLPVCRV